MCLEKITTRPLVSTTDGVHITHSKPLAEKVTRIFLGMVASAASMLCLVGFAVSGHPLALGGGILFGITAVITFSSACDEDYVTTTREPAHTTVIVEREPQVSRSWWFGTRRSPYSMPPIAATPSAPSRSDAAIAHAQHNLRQTARQVQHAQTFVTPPPATSVRYPTPPAPATSFYDTIDSSKVTDTGRARVGTQSSRSATFAERAPRSVSPPPAATSFYASTIDSSKVTDTGRARVGTQSSHAAATAARRASPPPPAPIARTAAFASTPLDHHKVTGSGPTARATVGTQSRSVPPVDRAPAFSSEPVDRNKVVGDGATARAAVGVKK